MPGQKERRHEMPIQKTPISDDRAGEERDADGYDHDLGKCTRREMFECLGLADRRHVFQRSPRQLDACSPGAVCRIKSNDCQNIAMRECSRWPGLSVRKIVRTEVGVNATIPNGGHIVDKVLTFRDPNFTSQDRDGCPPSP